MTVRLFLVRHGESESNRAGTLEGYADAPLTDLGHQQARQTAARLAEMGVRADLLLSSPLTRARDTAAAIAETLGAEVQIDARLRAGEGRVGEPESLAGEEMAAVFADATDAGHRTVVAVSHRLPIRAYLATLIGVDAAQETVDRLPNGGVWSWPPVVPED